MCVFSIGLSSGLGARPTPGISARLIINFYFAISEQNRKLGENQPVKSALMQFLREIP